MLGGVCGNDVTIVSMLFFHLLLVTRRSYAHEMSYTCHHLLRKDATVRHAYMCTSSVSRMLHVPYKCTCISSSAPSWRRRIRPVSGVCRNPGCNLMSHRTNRPPKPDPYPLSVVLDSTWRRARNPNERKQKPRAYDKHQPDHQSTPRRYRTREEHNSTRQSGPNPQGHIPSISPG